MRHPERGMSMWPFVVTLVLLLMFIVLWYSQKGDADQLKTRNAELAKENVALQEQKSKVVDSYAELSKVVGYATETVEGRPVTNLTTLQAALNPDQAGSPLAELKAKSTLAVKRDFFKGKEAPATATLDLAQLPSEFKAKVQEVIDAQPPRMPAMPDDPDDEVAMAEYAAKRAEYDAKFQRYRGLIDELVKMKEFKQYQAPIAAGPGYDPDKSEVVNVLFWERPPSGMLTAEEALKVAPKIVEAMSGTMKTRMESLLAEIDGLQKLNDELKRATDNEDAAAPGLKQQLLAVQEQLAADTAKLQREAQEARTALEALRVSETAAQQGYAKEKEDRKVDVSKLEQTNRALENRVREEKERKDLAIARDDADGILLGADGRLGVAYINLGSADKVYAGLPFRVWYVGRGAIRVSKGEVVVTKVLDAHYSQVRIAFQVDGERPMGAGDSISNPFYDAKKPVYVFLAGELQKYPKAIAVARLQRMGVVVQDSITDKTDWVVIPDSIVVAPTAPAAGGEGEGEGAGAPAETEFARLERLARPFGATLVTEKLIESFLGY
jgi:hypothetical protein